MFSKTITMLAAITIVGTASGAFAYDDPDNRIGDRYPWLDASSRSVAARNIGAPYVPARGLARLDQPMPEDVEARIGDRYPGLERNAAPGGAARLLSARFAMRQSAVAANYDDPAGRISDRYPQLERISPQRGGGVYVTARRSTRPGA